MANILIVDDNEAIRDMLDDVLTAEGHVCFVASTGKVAIDLLSDLDPELVITDILMPDQEGIETIVKLRKRWPGVKIIAMSGGGEHIGGEDCLKLAKTFGAEKVFEKPIDVDVLIKAVRESLG